MKTKQISQGWLVRLEKGELLVGALLNACTDHNVQSGWLQGIGAVSELELGFYDLEHKEYHWKKFNQLLEITSIQGNISQLDGVLTLHLHGNFSDQNYQVFGGHVKEAVIGGTGEFIIAPFDDELSRSHSDEIGLNLLDL